MNELEKFVEEVVESVASNAYGEVVEAAVFALFAAIDRETEKPEHFSCDPDEVLSNAYRPSSSASASEVD